MRDILYELNYMDNVIQQLNGLKVRSIEPNDYHIDQWRSYYCSEGMFTNDNSLSWLFANEYYCMIKEG